MHTCKSDPKIRNSTGSAVLTVSICCTSELRLCLTGAEWSGMGWDGVECGGEIAISNLGVQE